jgi:predicted site-specific integrase-resolvase
MNEEKKTRKPKTSKDIITDEFVPARVMSKMVGLKYQTALKLAESVGFRTFTTPSGQKRYHKRSIDDYINEHSNVKEILPIEEKHNVVYCRVSTKKQSADLQRQVDYAKSLYPSFEVITDIASGINWKRKGLDTILEYTMQRNLGELVVFHKDRLSRFGFDLLKKIITLSGGKVTVHNDKEETKYESTNGELAEDIMSIIHVYSCREMGKRRHKNKDEKSETISNEKTEETIDEMDL